MFEQILEGQTLFNSVECCDGLCDSAWPNNNEDRDGTGAGITGLNNGNGFGVCFKYYLY